MNDIKTDDQSIRLKKGDGLVLCEPESITFMEIDEVDESTDSMDFCTVSWYTLDIKGVNIQRRFPMAARDSKFCNFRPVSSKALKEAKKVIRDFNSKIKSMLLSNSIQRHYKECSSYLRNLIGEQVETSATLPEKEKKPITNQWLDCTFENNWIEENIELADKYLSIVCLTHDTYDDDGKPIVKHFTYVHDFCPISWNVLVESGAKYMVIEKPNTQSSIE